MVRFAFAAFAALLLVITGCASAPAEESDTATGAATSAESPPIANGFYGGHMHLEFDGSLTITNASADSLDFDFEISLDQDNSGEGELKGTAKRTTTADGKLTFEYVDGDCVLDMMPDVDGQIFVNPTSTCGLYLNLDHTVDFTATWFPMKTSE